MTLKFQVVNGETGQIDEKGFIILTAKTDEGKDFFITLYNLTMHDIPREKFDSWLASSMKNAFLSLDDAVRRG